MSKRDEFVNRVAKEVLNGLSDKDQEYIYMNPNSVAHHFGLGLMIHNTYITTMLVSYLKIQTIYLLELFQKSH